MSQESKSVVIVRELAAPINLVWDLWTDPAHFQQWYGPPGFTVPVAELDVRVGGKRKICMQSPDGSMRMWFTGRYREVEQPLRLVFTDCNCDEDGNLLPPSAMGMPGDEPFETLVEVVLEEFGSEGCKLQLTHHGVPADSPGAKGWTMALDKLAAIAEGSA